MSDRPCTGRRRPTGNRRARRSVRESQLLCRCWWLCCLLDLLQCRDAALANRRVTLRFTDARRIVPAALALLAVRNRDRNRNALTFRRAAKLNLRHDEQIPQVTLMPLKQFERAPRSLQRDLRLQ